MLADDLLTELYLQAPRRPEGWQAAFVHATSAVALLRYHAAAAAPLAREERFARLAGVRDALMAENLLAIRAAEAHRGPTLVFAHNTHLQRHLEHHDDGRTQTCRGPAPARSSHRCWVTGTR